MLALKVRAARAAGALSRRTGRGGTSLPGKLLLRMEPHAIHRLSRGLTLSAVISATNGKTTTAAMASSILERGGSRLVHNRAGANMAGGIAAALADGAGDTGLFEVDEFCDQLDRYGELETIADRWAAVAAASARTRLVLNADDPLVADLGRDHPDATYYGVDDDAMALEGMQHASDSKHCRRCGAPYHYDAVFLGHLGRYHCDACGQTRPVPAIAARNVTLDGIRGARFTLVTPAGEGPVSLPLPGLYNVYNALGAAALTLTLGAPLDDVIAGLEATAPAFGRAETVRIGEQDLSIMLVKNPAGANEVLRTLALEDGQHDVFAVLNDNIADGRDVSWVWDADFEVLAPRVRRAVCSGTRAAEMALRLKYAGVPVDRLEVEPGLAAGLDRALSGGDGRLFALPTYTAMLALRDLLVARGVAGSSFL
jgi:lipid II isoglutaminyl synthase (glutamine-hydrolysing)